LNLRANRSILWVLAVATMLLVLLAPALWNGFPLIFPDTGGYLARPFDHTLEMGRSAFYGVFLALGIPFDFWPNVVAQAALTLWVVHLTLRAYGLGGRPLFALGAVLVLAVCTPLPWYAGQLMPDIFFPVAVLALYLLAFRHGDLRQWERITLMFAVAFSVASHMALLGLCIGIVAVLRVLSRIPALALPSPRLMLPAAALAAGIAFSLFTNLAVAGKFAFTPGGESFLFGRLIDDGMIARYLKERCPDPSVKLCAYANKLPAEADDWLWGSETPFYKLGGWQDYAAEERRIIADTLLLYPGEHLKNAIRAVLWQLVLFKSDVTTNPWHNMPTVWVFERLTPQLLPDFHAARQQAEPFDLGPLNILHVPFAALAMAGIVAVLILRRRLQIPPPDAALCVTVLAALFINAAISGVFSHAVDRYQNRLVPLAPLALIVVGLRRWKADEAAQRLSPTFPPQAAG
jgi:hypothetical protein